jgi:hypothetical protein
MTTKENMVALGIRVPVDVEKRVKEIAVEMTVDKNDTVDKSGAARELLVLGIAAYEGKRAKKGKGGSR